MTPERIDALEQEQIRAALARLRGRLPVGLSEEELLQGYQRVERKEEDQC